MGKKYKNDPGLMKLVHDTATFLNFLRLEVIPQYLRDDISNLRERFLDALPDGVYIPFSKRREPFYRVGAIVYARFKAPTVDRVVISINYDKDNGIYVYHLKCIDKRFLQPMIKRFNEDEIDLVANRVSSN